MRRYSHRCFDPHLSPRNPPQGTAPFSSPCRPLRNPNPLACPGPEAQLCRAFPDACNFLGGQMPMARGPSKLPRPSYPGFHNRPCLWFPPTTGTPGTHPPHPSPCSCAGGGMWPARLCRPGVYWFRHWDLTGIRSHLQLGQLSHLPGNPRHAGYVLSINFATLAQCDVSDCLLQGTV